MPKIAHERWKTYKNVFDEFTLRTLFKLSTEGHFDELKSPISIGKESNVFSASKDDGKVIAKIYRLETCDFNRMYDYIKSDPRYGNLKKQRRLIIFAWCQREYRNLLKAREAGINVPKPIAFLNNVLIEEFIGDKDAAPKLKDSFPKKPEEFFERIIEDVIKLYKAKLVHTDLSSFNILNHNEKPVFIDFSQCTTLNDPNSQAYLERDIYNVITFFNKGGLNIKKEKIIKKITES